MADGLDILKKQIELQEQSLASEQRKQEIMKAGGIHYQTRRKHAKELLKAEDDLLAVKQDILATEGKITAEAGKQAQGLKAALMVGGALLGVVDKMQDLSKKYSENVESTQGSLGLSVNAAKQVNAEISSAITGEKMFQTTLGEVVAQQSALKDAFGGSTQFTADQAVNLDIASKKLGISNTQAASFAKLMFSTGESIDDMGVGLMAGTKALAAASGVSFDSVMKDVAASGETMAKTFGMSATEIATMAVAARKLGFELSDINSMSDALLDTEGRIEKQMSFNLLTGKDINLDKAAALAYAGDEEGMMREIAGLGLDLNGLKKNEIKLLNEALGVDIMKLKNADALAEKKAQEGIDEQAILETKALLEEKQLASFALDLEQNEAAKTSEGRKIAFEENLLEKQTQMITAMDEQNNMASILRGIQVAIQIAMGAQAIASALKDATEKSTLRSAAAALPKMVAQSVMAGITATAKFLGMSASTLGIGAAATLAAVAIGGAYYSSQVNKVRSEASQTGDLSIDPNGGPVVMSPQEGGLFQGTKNDGVSMSPNHGSGGGGGGAINIKPLIDKLDQLISAVNTQRVLSVDGYQLNEAMHLEKTPVGI